MQLSNCVVGQVIEAKRDVKGFNYGTIPKGLQVVVGRLQLPAIDECPVRVDHNSFSDGYEWVNPADFRKVKEAVVPTPSDGISFSGLREHQERMLAPKKPVLTEECTKQNLQVGDTVLVGTNGAGYHHVLPEYAGLTCEVIYVHFDGSVDIYHPDVHTWGNGYRSKLKHLTKIVKEPVVESVVQEFQEGDVLECITDCEGEHNEKCVAGRLYRFSSYCKYGSRDGIQVHDPDLWCNHALVLPEDFKLYARVKPVKDSNDADTPTA